MKIENSEIYNKLSDDVKAFIVANQAFSDSLVAYSKVLEALASDLKEIKIYFKDVRGGFRDDLKEIGQTNIKDLDTQIEILEKKVDELPKQIFTKILILFLGSTGIISLIVYLVEHFLFNNAVHEISQEILKNLPK